MSGIDRPVDLWVRLRRFVGPDRESPDDRAPTRPEPHWRAPVSHRENGLTHHEFAHVLGMGRVSPLFQRHRW
ncbi:hypothetical protein ACWGKS_14685 [Nocardiopsis sp. NPDC055879]